MFRIPEQADESGMRDPGGVPAPTRVCPPEHPAHLPGSRQWAATSPAGTRSRGADTLKNR